jgi:Uma2 family endonuclease
MSTVVLEDTIRIPDYVQDLDSFCRWVSSPEFPEQGRFGFLNGEVWVDMSPEELYTHGQVKNEYATTLTTLVKTSRGGRFYPDRTWLTNEPANLSTEPDGTYVSRETLQSGRVRRIRGRAGYIRLEGTPDMVLEVLSRTSQYKDPVVLRQLYWKAGIPEYWLVDARKEPVRFTIFRRTREGYVPVRKQAGWVKSAVFGKSFQLTVQPDELGDPEYTLSVR